MKVPAGWTEIDDPIEGREFRHFEAIYARDGESRRVEVASRTDDDESCLAAIADAEKLITEDNGELVA